MKKKLSYLGISLSFSIIIILFISFIQMFFFKNEYPFVYKPVLILSGSMEPKISTDDLAITKRATNLSIGDVVLYKNSKGNRIMHRVVDISGDRIITRGDANNVNDNPIHYSDIVGLYVGKVKYIGKIIKFIKTPLGLLIIFIIMLIIYLIPNEKENKIESNIENNNSDKFSKIIIEGSVYIVLIVICLLSGYYSKYVLEVAGKGTGNVAKWNNDVTIDTTEEIVFKNNRNNTLTIPIKVKSSSEVASIYHLIIENLFLDYNVSLSSDGYNLSYSINDNNLSIVYNGENINFDISNNSQDVNGYHMDKYISDDITHISIMDKTNDKKIVEMSLDGNSIIDIIYINAGKFLIGSPMQNDFSLNITTNSNKLPSSTGVNISATFEQID